MIGLAGAVALMVIPAPHPDAEDAGATSPAISPTPTPNAKLNPQLVEVVREMGENSRSFRDSATALLSAMKSRDAKQVEAKPPVIINNNRIVVSPVATPIFVEPEPTPRPQGLLNPLFDRCCSRK